MLRKNVPTNSSKMLVILHVSVSEEVDIYIYIYIYISMTESFGKNCCWNGIIVCKGNVLWNVSTRLKVKEKSTYVDGISKLSGIEIREQKIYMFSKGSKQ
jgi:hypothetical protein